MKVEAAFSKLSEADIIALPVAQLPEVETETVITPVPTSAAAIEQGAAHLGGRHRIFYGNTSMAAAIFCLP